jgi:hypothetical protein
MIHTCHQRYFSIAGLVFCLAVLALGQVTNSKKFHSVPEPLRDRLVARLNLYIENERTRQYEKLWDLLSPAYIAQQRLSRENYLQYRSDDRLMEFKPTAVAKSPIRWRMRNDGLKEPSENVDVFEIHGIAKFQRGNKVVLEERLLEARFESDNWYFSEWLVTVQ